MLTSRLRNSTLLCLLLLFAGQSRADRGCGDDGDDGGFNPFCFPPSKKDNKKLSGGAIAGSVVGSVAGLAALLTAVWFWWRRRRARARARQEVDIDPESADVRPQTAHVTPTPLLSTILRATHGQVPPAKAGATTDFRSIPNDSSHADGDQSDLRIMHSSSGNATGGATSPLHSEMAAYQSTLKEDLRRDSIPVDAIDPPPMYRPT
ncbi:hypothetical protein OF83DRAFT_1176765 [Amylostereum chailletii]|nr:hypothetical protein OF83DRAFT_1176765 [Amylostereum chailletii]